MQFLISCNRILYCASTFTTFAPSSWWSSQKKENGTFELFTSSVLYWFDTVAFTVRGYTQKSVGGLAKGKHMPLIDSNWRFWQLWTPCEATHHECVSLLPEQRYSSGQDSIALYNKEALLRSYSTGHVFEWHAMLSQLNLLLVTFCNDV